MHNVEDVSVHVLSLNYFLKKLSTAVYTKNEQGGLIFVCFIQL
jgi:hypothetical protein